MKENNIAKIVFTEEGTTVRFFPKAGVSVEKVEERFASLCRYSIEMDYVEVDTQSLQEMGFSLSL